MSVPGYYRKEDDKLIGPLYPQQIEKLGEGTEIILHSHLHGDRFQKRIQSARADSNQIVIVQEKKFGNITSSDILADHDQGAALNYLIVLGRTLDVVGRRGGVSPGEKRPKRTFRPQPAWLLPKTPKPR